MQALIWLVGMVVLIAYIASIRSTLEVANDIVGRRYKVSPNSAWFILVPLIQWPWSIFMQFQLRSIIKEAVKEDVFARSMWWGIAFAPFQIASLGLSGYQIEASFLLGLFALICLIVNWVGIVSAKTLCEAQHLASLAEGGGHRGSNGGRGPQPRAPDLATTANPEARVLPTERAHAAPLPSDPHAHMAATNEVDDALKERAASGDAEAMLSFAKHLRLSTAGGWTSSESREWLLLSAKAEHVEAQRLLGELYQRGEGVPQDYVLAHAWFNLAASAGDQASAQFRDSLAARMTIEQIADAQRMARDRRMGSLSA